jgi:hypothetical protein
MSTEANKAVIQRYLQEGPTNEAIALASLTGDATFTTRGRRPRSSRKDNAAALPYGKIAEARSNIDQLGLLQQLGVLPPVPGSSQ